MAGKNAASTSKAAKSNRNERAPFVGYVNITLTEEDRVDYEGWNSNEEFFTEAYLDMLDKGYQFTLKLDTENDAYQCSVSNWNITAQDSGVIYTARAATLDTAIRKAVFVWERKLDRNLNNGAVKGTRKDAF